MSGRELRAGALVGLLLIGATGMVSLAENRGAPSSYAALIFASIPLWVVLLRRLGGERPPTQTYVGVAVGYVGVVLLLLPGEQPDGRRPRGGAHPDRRRVLLVGRVGAGPATSRRRRTRRSRRRSRWAAAGSRCCWPGRSPGSGATSTRARISVRTGVAFAYLVLIGSIVGFSAFVWLLQHAPISQVATYAYVNPVVALVLGRLFFTESVTVVSLVGTAVIVGSVAFVVRHEAAPPVEARGRGGPVTGGGGATKVPLRPGPAQPQHAGTNVPSNRSSPCPPPASSRPVSSPRFAALTPAAALAKDGDVRVTGKCSRSSSAKLKLKLDNSRIETEFEVDQNRNGVRWTVTLRRNGALAASTKATTKAPSGSFTVRRLLTNGPGADTVTAKATSPSGEICTARARIT